jgi:hypothetical protein
MSFWITRKESGGRKSIFTIAIAWEFIPLLILILTAAVIALLKN